VSGIAAIIRFDGGDIEPGEIERMTAAMDYRGPDGIAHWRKGPVALGHCMLRTTAESLEEVQPLANEDESLVLVMDGWLSNWEELRSELVQRGAKLRSRSDAELVLRAYEQWGEACPAHIEGEYAFLIWDGHRRVAYCARDHAGLRPLHCHWDGKRLVVASDIVGVLTGPGVEVRPNPGTIAEFAACEWYSRTETIWSDVLRPLPAHWLRFHSGGTDTGRYWDPPLEIEILCRTEEEYFEQYREIFHDCVRRASRSHLPVACDVSGGLDSSAVFAVARRLQYSGRLEAPDVEGFTYRFRETGGLADEIEYARAVARHLGVGLHEIEPFMPELSWFAERGKADRDMAPYPNTALAVSIGKALTDLGMRVSLNGVGGDEWLYGSRLYYAEQISMLDWRGFCSSIRADLKEVGLSAAIWWPIRFGILPLLPKPLKNTLRGLHAAMGSSSAKAAPWLSPALNRLLDERRASFVEGTRRVANPARRGMLMTLEDPYLGITRDNLGRMCARGGYDARFPMHGRKFIEFAFSIPEAMRLRGSTKKYLHVKALADDLPEVVAQRKTKAAFIEAVTRLVDGMRPLLVETLPFNGTGHLDYDGMSRLYSCYEQSGYDNGPAWQLWGAFGCENAVLAEAVTGKRKRNEPSG